MLVAYRIVSLWLFDKPERGSLSPILTVGYYSDFETFLTQVAENGSMQSKSKTSINFLFFVLLLGTAQSARSSGAPLLKSYCLGLVLHTIQHSRISTEVQIGLEIKITSICILNQSGNFHVCFEEKLWSNLIG